MKTACFLIVKSKYKNLNLRIQRAKQTLRLLMQLVKAICCCCYINQIENSHCEPILLDARKIYMFKERDKENVAGCVFLKRNEKFMTACLPSLADYLWHPAEMIRKEFQWKQVSNFAVLFKEKNLCEQSHEISRGGDQEQKWIHWSSVLGRLEVDALNPKTG